MKKIISVLLAVLIAAACVPFCASAVNYSGQLTDTLSWVINTSTGNMTITGTGDMPDYTGTAVTPWYRFNTFVKNLNFDVGVTHIGNYAFCDMPNLVNVAFPKRCKTIGKYAFAESDKIDTVKAYGSLEYIDECAFQSCDGLKSVYLESAPVIGKNAFSFCRELTSVKFPLNLKTISEKAFYYCDKLTTFTFYSSLETIGEKAFYYCSSVSEFNIPASVTNIGENAFLRCDSVESYTVDAENPAYCSVNGVLYTADMSTLIKYPAYKQQCSEFTVPSSVRKISVYAFNNSLVLNKVTLNNVTELEDSVFVGCVMIKSIYPGSQIDSIGIMLTDCSTTTVYCYENSYLHNYCVENEIKYELLSCAKIPATFYGADNKSSANIKLSANDTDICAEAVYKSAQNGGTFYVPDCTSSAYTLVISKPGHTKYTVLNYNPLEVLTDTPEIYAGDVNGDGVINTKDISSALSAYTAENYNSDADFNEDGFVNAKDLSVLISNYTLTDITINAN